MARHLTMEEREVISQMTFAGESPAAIARRLERHRTTISREVDRNSTAQGYSAVAAHRRAQARRRERPRVRKMDQPEINRSVRQGLGRRWSPDQIAGRMRREAPHNHGGRVSHQTIYTWIRQQPDPTQWERCLRRGGRRRPRQDRRGQLPACVTILGRPQVVDRRERYGDWEGDTIVGRRHTGGLVTLNERKSGYVFTRKVLDRTAERVRRAIEQRLRELPPDLRRTLTLDNGKEFADHARFARTLEMDVYFAQPYKAWQRGSNENTNGLLRQFFPKGTDFRDVSWQTVEYITTLLNTRPRKRLDYRTPCEVFSQRLAAAIET